MKKQFPGPVGPPPSPCLGCNSAGIVHVTTKSGPTKSSTGAHPSTSPTSPDTGGGALQKKDKGNDPGKSDPMMVTTVPTDPAVGSTDSEPLGIGGVGKEGMGVGVFPSANGVSVPDGVGVSVNQSVGVPVAVEFAVPGESPQAARKRNSPANAPRTAAAPVRS